MLFFFFNDFWCFFVLFHYVLQHLDSYLIVPTVMNDLWHVKFVCVYKYYKTLNINELKVANLAANLTELIVIISGTGDDFFAFSNRLKCLILRWKNILSLYLSEKLLILYTIYKIYTWRWVFFFFFFIYTLMRPMENDVFEVGERTLYTQSSRALLPEQRGAIITLSVWYGIRTTFLI